MRDLLAIRDVRFSPAHERAGDLLGFVSFRLGHAVVVDGVAVHRSGDGAVRLAFPQRIDRAGGKHAIVRPFDQAARDAITAQVAAVLQDLGVLR